MNSRVSGKCSFNILVYKPEKLHIKLQTMEKNIINFSHTTNTVGQYISMKPPNRPSLKENVNI